MGMDAYATLCYGVVMPEEFEPPWIDENEDENIEEWWLGVCGIENPLDSVYDEDGNTIPDITADQVGDAWKRRAELLAANPMPAEIVSLGEYDPTHIISSPAHNFGASWDGATEINMDSMRVTPEQHDALVGFCRKHLHMDDPQPKWYLTADYS